MKAITDTPGFPLVPRNEPVRTTMRWAPNESRHHENAAPLIDDDPRRRGQPELGSKIAHPEELSGQSRAVNGAACPVVAEALRVVGVHMRQEMRCNGRSTLHPQQRARNWLTNLLRTLPYQAAASPQSEMVSCGQCTGRSVPTHGADPTAHTSAIPSNQ